MFANVSEHLLLFLLAFCCLPAFSVVKTTQTNGCVNDLNPLVLNIDMKNIATKRLKKETPALVLDQASINDRQALWSKRSQLKQKSEDNVQNFNRMVFDGKTSLFRTTMVMKGRFKIPMELIYHGTDLQTDWKNPTSKFEFKIKPPERSFIRGGTKHINYDYSVGYDPKHSGRIVGNVDIFILHKDGKVAIISSESFAVTLPTLSQIAGGVEGMNVVDSNTKNVDFLNVKFGKNRFGKYIVASKDNDMLPLDAPEVVEFEKLPPTSYAVKRSELGPKCQECFSYLEEDLAPTRYVVFDSPNNQQRMCYTCFQSHVLSSMYSQVVRQYEEGFDLERLVVHPFNPQNYIRQVYRLQVIEDI